MKSYDELIAEMNETKKCLRAEALKKVKKLWKEFCYTAGMLKGAFVEGRKNR